MKKKSKWVPCSYRLPSGKNCEESNEFLCWDDSYDGMRVLSFDVENDSWKDTGRIGGGIEPDARITFWRPLPKPPNICFCDNET